ncbi:Dabb family protein [Dokdonia sp. Asnod1-B02]|uniref:Dabb family protein n=1 Tax=Dokdonia sp. Asnod1-B02 TaxID=3160573 RepID=UPI00386714ED
MKIQQQLIILFIFSIFINSCDQKESTVGTAAIKNNVIISTDSETAFNENYAHIVYFWFKDPTNEEDKQLFEKSLRTFLDSSLYAKTQFIGTAPRATREVVDDSFTYNLVLSFASAEDQQAYQDEAAHKMFIEECAHLWEKVIVYDATSIR